MSSSCTSFRWLLLALIQVSGTVLGEIEKLKNCGRKTLCNGRTPEQFGNQYYPNVTRSSPCYCDDDCSEFGDCCLDIALYPNYKAKENTWDCVQLTWNQVREKYIVAKFAYFLRDESGHFIYSPNPIQWISSAPLERTVYAVSSCDLNHTQWKYKCEKNVSSDEYHYALDIPVYSNLTGVYYANIYCAYCHEKIKSIDVPQLSISCSNNITIEMLLKFGVYQKGKLMWQVGRGFCSMSTLEQIRNARPCVLSESNCPSDVEPILSAKCKAYSMILSGSEKMYRNAHCALCNGVNMSNLHCWYGYTFRNFPSLSMVLNFNWDFSSCKIPESVWDGLQQRCTFTNYTVNLVNKISTLNNSNSDGIYSDKYEDHLSLKVDGYLTYIFLSVSVICLLLHMFISVSMPHPKTVPAKILDSLAISLMIAQTLFLGGISPFFEVTKNICHIIAILIQFFFLASFFWMNAISIDIWSTFSNKSLKNNSAKSHTKYAIYAWGSATMITAFSITAEQTNFSDKIRPHYAAKPNVCWFGNPTGLAIFFYFPILFLLILNTILFTITVCWFQKHHNSSETLKTSGRKEYNRLWLYIKLSIIMGTSWAFGMITSITKKPTYRYPFTVLNGLQGAFILVMFDLKTDIAFLFLKQLGFRDFRNRSTNQAKSDSTHSSRVSASSKVKHEFR